MTSVNAFQNRSQATAVPSAPKDIPIPKLFFWPVRFEGWLRYRNY